MSRARTAALLAVLVSMLALPAVPAGASPALRMQEKVNAFRARHGLKPLRFSGSLANSAHRYAQSMMSRGYFGHSSRIHASRKFRTLGEIIEMHRGRRARVGLALRMWKHSSYHRGLLLSSNFRFGGAGFTTGRYHGHRRTMWVMHFGRK